MNPGLHEFNLASHLVWWVAGAVFLVLAVVGIVELWDAVRGRLSGRRSPRRPSGGDFRVREGSRVRRRHFRRFRPGYDALRSRGLGDPPIVAAGEWSPTEGAGKDGRGSGQREE